VLAREAIERWLDELQRVARDRAVAEYAQEAAGTRDDMDRELEAAGIEVLAGKVRRRR
jgi:hypothetical protein